MFRYLIVTPLLACALATPLAAQEWARKMFAVTSHDFETVARGARAEFAFEVTNLYKEEVHLAGVRASCGCVTPTITKDRLKTWEKGTVLVTFNTRSFVGHRTATITVTIDQPYYAEVQLNIAGFIRGDVVVEPGVLEFPAVTRGTPAEKAIQVKYAGRSDWKILDVRSANEHLEVEMAENTRGQGRVAYDLRVRLKDDAPVGYFRDQMVLVTDDPSARQIPVPIEGNVLSPLTVSPAALNLGVVKPGQTVTRQLVVRASQPFHITGINCPDGCFQFAPSEEAKQMHLVPVTFTAAREPGKVVQKIEIVTDMGTGARADFMATAVVRVPDTAETAPPAGSEPSDLPIVTDPAEDRASTTP